jgi:hypothetical protein
MFLITKNVGETSGESVLSASVLGYGKQFPFRQAMTDVCKDKNQRKDKAEKAGSHRVCYFMVPSTTNISLPGILTISHL